MAEGNLPPYMSIGVFKGTLETLADTTVPTGPLDRRVLDGLSGADYGALISGLRFLGLVNEDRTATDTYRELVRAFKTPEKYRDLLREILEGRYASVIGDVDIAHGTITQLEKAFRDAGVSQGQMLTKTVRFFVKAMQDSGVEVSPHITKPRKPSPRGDTPRRKRGGGNGEEENGGDRDPGAVRAEERKPDGYSRLPIPGLPNTYIQYPDNISEANCDLFEAMIGVLRTYAKTRKEKKG